MTWTSFEGPMM